MVKIPLLIDAEEALDNLQDLQRRMKETKSEALLPQS